MTPGLEWVYFGGWILEIEESGGNGKDEEHGGAEGKQEALDDLVDKRHESSPVQ